MTPRAQQSLQFLTNVAVSYAQKQDKVVQDTFLPVVQQHLQAIAQELQAASPPPKEPHEPEEK